jgi:hypothetical protein
MIPETLVPPRAPFLQIDEQPEQVAVKGPSKPETATAAETIAVESSTSERSVKEKASGATSCDRVVAVQEADVVPTLTEAEEEAPQPAALV